MSMRKALNFKQKTVIADWLRNPKLREEMMASTAAQAATRVFAELGIECSAETVRSIAKDTDLPYFQRNGTPQARNADVYSVIAMLAKEIRSLNELIGRQSIREASLTQLVGRKWKQALEADRTHFRDDGEDEDPLTPTGKN